MRCPRSPLRLLGLTLALVGCFEGDTSQAPSTATRRVVSRIHEHTDWLTAAQKCPKDVMPKSSDMVAPLGNDHCKPAYERCLALCESGSATACYWLAYELQQREIDEPAYEALYQRACGLGVVSGCTNRAAGQLHEQRDVFAVMECSARTFEAGCDYDDPWACTMSARLLSRGIGVPRNDALALKRLEKSCKYGDSDPACQSAKRMRADILARSKKSHDSQ